MVQVFQWSEFLGGNSAVVKRRRREQLSKLSLILAPCLKISTPSPFFFSFLFSRVLPNGNLWQQALVDVLKEKTSTSESGDSELASNLKFE